MHCFRRSQYVFDTGIRPLRAVRQKQTDSTQTESVCLPYRTVRMIIVPSTIHSSHSHLTNACVLAELYFLLKLPSCVTGCWPASFSRRTYKAEWNMAKATSAENCKLNNQFDEVRRALLEDRFRDSMEKPLAYWA